LRLLGYSDPFFLLAEEKNKIYATLYNRNIPADAKVDLLSGLKKIKKIPENTRLRIGIGAMKKYYFHSKMKHEDERVSV
jgi:hypothetical protein